MPFHAHGSRLCACMAHFLLLVSRDATPQREREEQRGEREESDREELHAAQWIWSDSSTSPSGRPLRNSTIELVSGTRFFGASNSKT